MGIEFYLVNKTKKVICMPMNLVGNKLSEWCYDGDYFAWLCRQLVFGGSWYNDHIEIVSEADIYLDESYTRYRFEIDRT